MAGERSLEGVAAGAATGAGVPGLLGLLLAMEAGVPVPLPSDLVMLLLGERVSAGAVPLWLAMAALEVVALAGTAALFLAARGPGRALLARVGSRLGLTGPRLARATELLERRGRPALATGRTTPGLRTVTVVAAASSGIRVGRALPALVLGSSLFLQVSTCCSATPSARRPGSCWSRPACRCWWPPPSPWPRSWCCCCRAAGAAPPGSWPRGPARRAWPSACSATPTSRPGPRTRRERDGRTGLWTTPRARTADRVGSRERPASSRPGAPCQVGRRYTSRLASLGLSERPRPDLSGQSRPSCPGDCWTCSTAGEPPRESDDLPELLNALVANSTTASPASTVATRMARQGRHPVRAAVTGSSGKRASFSRRP
jgi:membrane protein DedA with SNARE-associated domain